MSEDAEHVGGDAQLYGYKPAREFDDISCVECGGEMDPEDLDDPDGLVSEPTFVHWGCIP